MSRHAQRVRNVKPSVVASSVLVLVLIAVPAALLGGVRPWATSDATPTGAEPSPVATVTPTSEPTPAPASESAAQPKRKPRPEPVVGSGGKVVRGTTLRLAPPPDDSSARALQRRAEALLNGGTVDETGNEPANEAGALPATFRVSSFNILGAGHTEARGKKPHFASGSTRMRWAMSLLQAANVSVAGLQEVETPQHAAFRQSSPGWDVFPGLKLTRSALANSIVWRRDVWQFVEGHTVDIPYFYGKPKPMPYLLLRHIDSGREVWFANFHNPASVRGPAAHWRREAVSREIALANRLSADGTPVIMTGDMNDRAEFFCPATTRAQLHAANGGSTGAPCRPPGNMGIDWIMGSAQVGFADYHAVRGGLVGRTSDHPFLWASATIGPALIP